MATVKVRALRSFCLGAGRDVKVGDVFEAGDWQAREWVGIGHAEVVKEEALPPPPTPPAAKVEGEGDGANASGEGEDGSEQGEGEGEHPEKQAGKVRVREPRKPNR